MRTNITILCFIVVTMAILLAMDPLDHTLLDTTRHVKGSIVLALLLSAIVTWLLHWMFGPPNTKRIGK